VAGVGLTLHSMSLEVTDSTGELLRGMRIAPDVVVLPVTKVFQISRK
jgi:hypothetical protein